MLYPQNGDRIVAMDTVTSLRPVQARGYLCLKPRSQQTNRTEQLIANCSWVQVQYVCCERSLSLVDYPAAVLNMSAMNRASGR